MGREGLMDDCGYEFYSYEPSAEAENIMFGANMMKEALEQYIEIHGDEPITIEALQKELESVYREIEEEDIKRRTVYAE